MKEPRRPRFLGWLRFSERPHPPPHPNRPRNQRVPPEDTNQPLHGSALFFHNNSLIIAFFGILVHIVIVEVLYNSVIDLNVTCDISISFAFSK